LTQFHLGDRKKFAHRERTVGIIAKSAEGVFGITTIDLSTATELFSKGTEISSDELLIRVSDLESVQKPRHERYTIAEELSEIELLLGVTVQRFAPKHGIVYGRVSALRGLAEITLAGQKILVTDLVEVTFDENRRESGQNSAEPSVGKQNPKLEGADSGSLITTWDGRVIGLLIAGVGHIAFVVPLHAFLTKNNLAHETVLPDSGHAVVEFENEEDWLAFQRHAARSRAGVDSMGAELSREFSLGLPALGEEAA
jgi:hypothetical protein